MKHDFRFLGGSLGCAEGEKLCLGFEYAMKNGLPVVVECKFIIPKCHLSIKLLVFTLFKLIHALYFAFQVVQEERECKV